MKGVITGDIINSTSIPVAQRANLLQVFSTIVDELQTFSPLQYDFFRGDSFQIIVAHPENAMLIAVLLRVGLRSHTPKELKQVWDARIAVGIGEVDFLSERVVVSDGEAFRLSGREFDELGKRNLAVCTRWDDVNGELKVSTAFADDIITNWTVSQSSVIYMLLARQMSQMEIANHLGQTFQNISRLLIVAKEKLVSTYLSRFNQLITNKLQ